MKKIVVRIDSKILAKARPHAKRWKVPMGTAVERLISTAVSRLDALAKYAKK